MTPSILSLVGLIGNAAIFVFGSAVVLIALLQSYRARFNQYLALMMGLFALWGIPNGLSFAGEPFNLDGETLIKISTTLYLGGMLALFFFVTEFGKADSLQSTQTMRLGVLGVIVVGIFLTWAGAIWDRVTIEEDGRFIGVLSLTGVFSVFVGMGIIGIIIYQLYQTQNPLLQRRDVLWAIIPIGLGNIPILLRLPFDQILHLVAMLTGMTLITRVALYDRLFNPLIELHNQLTRKNEELEKANKVKNEFLANMSHELRTPLNSIIGYTDLVMGGAYGMMNEKQLNRLKKINSNGKKLLELINNVLDLSKLNAERLELHPTRVLPQLLIDDILATLHPLIEEKGLWITRSYHQLPPLYVDETRARQIILNVIANAVKFTPRGSITIGGYLDAVRNHVIFSIVDTSISIHPSDVVLIQEALKKTDENTPQQLQGLGLSISKRLAELHGGDVWFENTTKRGSMFYVRLPAATEMLSEVLKEPPIDPKTQLGILAVDRDLETIEVIQDYLQAEGFRVYGALTGREALLRARELNPNIVILDAEITGMDGWRTLELLKADETLKNIPVIMTSVNDYGTALVERRGARMLIVKPISRRSLLNAVQSSHKQVLTHKN